MTKTTEALLEEREETHGDFTHVADYAQNLKRVMRGGGRFDDELSDVMRESLDVIASKIGRILSGNAYEPDHWRDIAGYATLVLQRLPKPPG